MAENLTTTNGSEIVESGEMPAPAAVSVFTASKRTFSVADVLAAAWFRGELEAVWQDFLSGIAAERVAEEQGLEPESELLQALSDDFRTGRDLITAEETEIWLSVRRLTVDDFTEFSHRQYWKQNTTVAAPPEVDYLDSEPEVQELFVKDVLFSDGFDHLARALSWRVAVSLAPAAAPPAPERVEAERSRFFERTGFQRENLSRCLASLGRDMAWFELMIELEAGYRSHCEELLTPENQARTLAALRLPLTCFEIESIDFDSEDAAREAFLCLDMDELSMEELAEQERYVVQRRQVLLEQFPEELQSRFLSAQAGQVLQLNASDNRFQLCRIASKKGPSLDEETVRERVDAELLSVHFSNLVSKQITWLIGRDAHA